MIISTSKYGLSIELHGREQFWSLRAKINIPINSIQKIKFYENFQDWRKWQIRMPGTNAPKLLLAGSYWTEEGWDFIYAKRPVGIYKPKLSDVLLIETNLNRYNRVIISINKDKADDVSDWWRKEKVKLRAK